MSNIMSFIKIHKLSFILTAITQNNHKWYMSSTNIRIGNTRSHIYSSVAISRRVRVYIYI